MHTLHMCDRCLEAPSEVALIHTTVEVLVGFPEIERFCYDCAEAEGIEVSD